MGRGEGGGEEGRVVVRTERGGLLGQVGRLGVGGRPERGSKFP